MKTKLTSQTVTNLLSGLTRDELRNLAKRFNLKTGKNRSDTEKTVAEAVAANQIKFSLVLSVKTAPSDTNKYGTLVYSRKIRNVKDDRILFPLSAPGASVPVADGEDQ